MMKGHQNVDTNATNDSVVTQQRTDVPINVIARVRPLIQNEYRHPVCIEVVDDAVSDTGNKTQIVVRQGYGTAKQFQKMYSFEKVLDPESSQQQVFAEVDGLALTSAFLNGQNCTIFVYGPTSTGKTFTMQGNAEDIIHGASSATPRQQSEIPQNSLVSQGGEQSFDANNDLDDSGTSPNHGRRMSNTLKTQGFRLAGVNTATMKKSSSLYQKRPIGNYDSPRPKQPSISKAASDMMIESRDKGIIQRVVDHVYSKFAARADLQKNCEIRISFLEIYKETVTDLLEGHKQAKKSLALLKLGSSQRNLSTMLNMQPSATTDTNEEQKKASASQRTKAKTFYGEQHLEEIIQERRTKMEIDPNSPDRSTKNDGMHIRRTEASKLQSPFNQQRKQYQVKENAIRGVYVKDLNEVLCDTAEHAYHCFLDGLMRKRMSQTVRNTSSSRSHTIFQIKLYMRASDDNVAFLLPQYQQENKADAKLIAKFSLIDLAGSERITEAEKNAERIDEARFINKSLSALGNVVAALRTQAKHNMSNNPAAADQPASQTRRSSFQTCLSSKSPIGNQTQKHTNSVRRSSFYENKQPAAHHVPFRDSKLTHILKDCLGSNSFTHMIICLSPSYLCLAESISTLAFTKNAKAVRQNIVENVQFKADMIQKVNKEQVRRTQSSQHNPSTTPQNSLLSQMAGGEEEATMLREVLQELSGGANISGLGIKELFQITLGQLRKFKEDHNDMSKQIEELKSAMDKDLSNPRTLEIITHAHSDYQLSDQQLPISQNSESERVSKNYTPMSYHSLPATSIIPDESTPGNQSSSDNLQIPLVTNQQTFRNNTLKSIEEEDHSSFLASPKMQPDMKQQLTNSHYSLPMSDHNLRPMSDKSVCKKHHRPKQPSTTSVVSFGGGGEPFQRPSGVSGQASGFKDDLGQSDRDNSDYISFSKMIKNGSLGNGVFGGLREQFQNSCETTVGRLPNPGNANDSSMLIETEPAENFEESTPCGCSLQKYQPSQYGLIPITASIIPVQNIQKLRQTKSIMTMRTVIGKHLRNFIRRRMIMAQGKGHQISAFAPAKLSGFHKRQSSHDASIMNSRNAKVQANLRSLLNHQHCLRQDIEANYQCQPRQQQSLSQMNLFEQSDRRVSHHEKGGMIQNTNSNQLRSSIPFEKPQQMLRRDQTSKSNTHRGSAELFISDVYSSVTDDFIAQDEMMQKGYESSPLDKKYDYQYPGESAFKNTQRAMAKHNNSVPPFEQSSQGNAGQFESSRYSGSNSQSIVTTQMAQSQSQVLIESGSKKGSKVSQHLAGVNSQYSNQMVKEEGNNSRSKKHQFRSQASLNSNDFIVVEEVNDNEISSDAFLRILKPDQHTFDSILTDRISKATSVNMGPLLDDCQLPKPQRILTDRISKANSVLMGPLLDDCQLPKHQGNRIEPQQQSSGVASMRPSSFLSSIQQDGNSSQFGDSRLWFNKSKLNSQEALTFQDSPVKYIYPQNQRRIPPKSLISDLNKVHLRPTKSQFGRKTYASETKKMGSMVKQTSLPQRNRGLQTILPYSNKKVILNKAISHDQKNQMMAQRVPGSSSFRVIQGDSPRRRYNPQKPQMAINQGPNKPTPSTFKLQKPLAGFKPEDEDFI